MTFTFLVFLVAIVYVGMVIRDTNILGTGTANYVNVTASVAYTTFGIPGILTILGLGLLIILLLLLFIAGTQPKEVTG